MNFLPATVTACEANQVTLNVGNGRSVTAAVADTTQMQQGAKVTLGLRPEHLSDTSVNEGQLEGEVIALEYLGAETYVYLACGNDEALVIRKGVIKSAGETAIRMGQRISVGVPPRACYLFDETGTALPRPD